MERVPALIMAAGLLAAVLVGAAAALLAYMERPVPRRLVYAGVAAVGVGWGPSLMWSVQDPAQFAAWASVGPIATAVLAVSRRYRFAGVLLVGFGLPATLWWGGFLVHDMLDATFTYDPLLIWWLLPGLAFVVLGGIGILAGNRTASAPPEESEPQRAMTLARAMTNAQSIGPFPVALLPTVPLGLVALLGVVGLSETAQLPWPLPSLLGGVVAAAIFMEGMARFIPRRARRAWEGLAFLASPEMERFRQLSGEPVPTSPDARRAWLARHPPTTETADMHAEILTITGDFEGARRAIEQMPARTPAERHARLAAEIYLDWVADAGGDVEALHASAEQVGAEGSDERLRARARAAAAEARRRAADGGDWTEPLVAIREAVGPRAGRLLRADSAPYRLRGALVVAVFVTLISATLARPG